MRSDAELRAALKALNSVMVEEAGEMKGLARQLRNSHPRDGVHLSEELKAVAHSISHTSGAVALIRWVLGERGAPQEVVEALARHPQP